MQVVNTTISQPEACKLRVVIKVQERAVSCRSDAWDENTRGWGGCDAKEILRVDVGCRGKVKDIDLPVLRLGNAGEAVSKISQCVLTNKREGGTLGITR